MTTKTMKTVLLGCVAAIALAACQGTEDAAREAIATNSLKTSVAKQAYESQTGPVGAGNVRVRQTMWLGTESVRSGNGVPLPAAIETADAVQISSAVPMSLLELSRRITMATGIDVTGANQLGLDRPGGSDLSDANEDPRNIQATIDYTGPLSGLLDMMSSKFGVSWEFRGGVIRIYDFDTRTFTLVAAPITSTLDNEIKSTINGKSGDSEEGGSTTTSDQTSGGGVKTAGSLNYWSRVEKDVDSLLPNGTKWSISPESGSVTVTARPAILERVAEYVKDQNARMSRQVAVSVTVLAIKKDGTEGFNADLNLQFQDASTDLGLAMNTIAPGVATAATSLLGTLSHDTEFSGSSMLVEAISQETNASLVTSGSVTTMNNQPAPIQISKEIAYVSGYESNSTDTSTIVTPELSSVTTGFSMAVLPRILPNGKVALNYSLGMSALDAMEEFGGDGDTTLPVQVPEVSARGFQQNVMLRSGDTLILGGFEQVSNEVARNKTGLISWLMGGNRNAEQQHERLIILITPVIIENPADLARMK